jgi:hypothetical protein
MDMALASEHMPLLRRLREGANCVIFLDGAPEPAADVADMLRRAATEIEHLREDAQRWRALMASGRMHFMGSAGIQLEAKPGTDGRKVQDCDPRPRPNEAWHFGMEFWSRHPAGGDPQFPDEFERKLMVAYADAMRATVLGRE